MSEQKNSKLVEEPVDLGNTTPEAESQTEKAPGQQTPERQSDEQYANVVDRLIGSHAGSVSDEERTALQVRAVEHIKHLDVQTQDELVKVYEGIIKDLKKFAEARGEASPEEGEQKADGEAENKDSSEVEKSEETDSKPAANQPEGVPTTEEVKAAQEEVESNKGKYSWKQKARMVLGLPSLAIVSLASRGNKFVRGEEESEEAYNKRMKKHKWSGILAVAGVTAYYGYKAYAGWKGIDTGDHSVTGGGSQAESNGIGDLNHDGVLDAKDTAIHNGFGYDFSEDPFNGEHKTGVHNWGNPLEHRGGETISGVTDMQDRWKESPEQMSTVAAEMGLDGFTTGNIEEMAEKMKQDPAFAERTHGQLQAILQNPSTKISEGTLEPGTYGSYFGTAVGEDVNISYDGNIDEPGTTIVIEYVDKNGKTQVIELKRECGGQVIHRNPVEQVVNNPVYKGQGGAPVYVAPTGTGGETPPTPGTSTTPETPTTPEVPEPQPEPEPEPEPEPPVELAPKKPEEDINVNPDLPEQLQMGDGRVGPGELKPATEPPAEYAPPAPVPETSPDLAPDATPNDRGNEGAPATPAPEAQVNGDTGGNTGDTGGF